MRNSHAASPPEQHPNYEVGRKERPLGRDQRQLRTPHLSGRIGTVYGPGGDSPEPSSDAGPAFDARGQAPVPSRPWPLQSYLELGASPSVVPCARLHCRQVLWEWGLAGLSESAELVVAELATNAVQAMANWVAARPPAVAVERPQLCADRRLGCRAETAAAQASPR